MAATTSTDNNGSRVHPSQTGSHATSPGTPGNQTHDGTASATDPIDQNVLPAEKPGHKELSPKARVLASLTLLIWLNLFAGGIFIDTKPSRCVINPEGVAALGRQSAVNGGRETNPCPVTDTEGRVIERPPLLAAWFLALIFFLPLNLALLCATAGVLGTFGNIANLYPDQLALSSHDHSNPYISGLLRGFFVYLFVISGMLVLDDAPFSNTSPAQYIRLAGFLSLLSFIVNYQPHIFSKLVDMAQNRLPNSQDGAVAVAQTEDDKMAVRGEKVKATENRDGTMTLQAEQAKD
ncbi:MAG TPA: hypothetical protein VGB76_06725 [Pyrinomonadaceae bacterium]|jgi:hypothetical protein